MPEKDSKRLNLWELGIAILVPVGIAVLTSLLTNAQTAGSVQIQLAAHAADIAGLKAARESDGKTVAVLDAKMDMLLQNFGLEYRPTGQLRRRPE